MCLTLKKTEFPLGKLFVTNLLGLLSHTIKKSQTNLLQLLNCLSSKHPGQPSCGPRGSSFADEAP